MTQRHLEDVAALSRDGSATLLDVRTVSEYKRENFMKITKREMDYLILGNVQVVCGMRKGQTQGEVVKGNVVNPK